MKPFRVNFSVIKIEDVRKIGSSIEINKIYEGIYFPLNNSVSFTDSSNSDNWSFWVGDTCELIPNNTFKKSIMDLHKKSIEIGNIDEAIKQASTFKTYEHADRDFSSMDEELKKYWEDIYYKLIQTKYEKK